MSARLDTTWGSRVDRSTKLEFSFEGKSYSAYKGDCIASALAANDQWVLSRSFKYHRPRGVLTMAGQDANTLVQLDGEPNVRADLRPVQSGMQVSAQNVHGSLKRDIAAVLDKFGAFMPVGFYYRTFFRPGLGSWLKIWEPVIRNFAGLGKISFDTNAPKYGKTTQHCDVLVVGAGPAGMAAALHAAKSGADVILVDQNPETGGALTYARFDLDKKRATEKLASLRQDIEAADNLRVLSNATCNGWFADNWLPVLQGDTVHRIRAEEVILATGTHEQPLVFRNNDLPGIMLSSAAQRLMRHFAVQPGKNAVVFAGNREGYLVALDLVDAGVNITAILDPNNTTCDERLAAEIGARGVQVYTGAHVLEAVGTAGNKHVRAVRVSHSDNKQDTFECDVFVVAKGFTPGYQLALHAGARLGHNDKTNELKLTDLPKHMHIAGSVQGMFDLEAVVRSGEIAGATAALALGYSAKVPPSITDTSASRMNFSMPIVPHSKGRDFIDFDEDLQVKDIKNAVADGYRELELVKRYSTVGMGPSQGRHSALPTAMIVASETGRSVATVGITTSRPPFGPEKLGLLAGPHHMPYRHTAMHQNHVKAEAKLTPVGAWKRPLYYGDSKDAQSIIQNEALNVRENVGMLDVSTLGKLAIRGPDAGAFLDRIYTMAHAKQPVGRVRYCLMLNDMGSVIDDGVAYRIADDHFYVTATTGAVARVFSEMLWLNAQWRMNVDIQNITAAFVGINVTGPNARKVLENLSGDIDLSADAFPFLEGRCGTIAECPVRVMRIGFTGELSYELHAPQSYGAALWEALAEAGAEFGLQPYGLEASRILRLEKGHIIIGQDTDALTTPDELGMEWALSKKKPTYLGKTAIQARRALGLKRKLCGFELTNGNAGKVGESSLVFRDGEPVGFVSSICYSPILKKTVGLAYAHPNDAQPGKTLCIRGLSGQEINAPVVSPHFFDPDNKRQDI